MSNVCQKSLMTLRGGGPRARHATAWSGKQMREANRVLPASHKSAERVKAGNRTTSAVQGGPVSEPVRRRVIEPMFDASLERGCRQRGCGRHGLRDRGEPSFLGVRRLRGAQAIARQLLVQSVVAKSPIPHGVKSVSKTGERSTTEPKNPAAASRPQDGMTEATRDRGGERRSPRSSPGTGKPFTWRRGTVDRACQQEVD
jgi:hypothetical protein